MIEAHGPAPESFSLAAWPFEPLVWLSLIAAAVAYVSARHRVAGWPPNRTACFLGGLGVLALALASPIATYEADLFSVHMAQHLLVTLVAAPLLVLGAPLALTMRAARPALRQRLARVAHAPIVRALTHPVVAWLVFAATMWATHFTPLYDLALENEFVHWLEHVLYLSAALLFWWPVAGLDPGAHRLSWPTRLAYLALAMPVHVFLGVAIYSTDQPLYDHYATTERTWGPSPPADQRAAGMMMWIAGNLPLLIALSVTFFAWMNHDRREAARIDRRLSD